MIPLNTALLLGFSLQVSLALVMVLAYAMRRTYPGYRSWTFALVCWVVAGGSFYGRELLGEAVSVVLCNGFYFASALLFYSGLARFYHFDQDRARQRQNALVALFMYGVVLFFLFVENDLNLRVLLNSLTVGFLMVRTGVDSLRAAGGRCLQIQKLLSGCFFLLASLIVLRGVMAMAMRPDTEILRLGSGILPLLMGNIMSLVVMVFCMITLTNCRLEQELIESRESLREQAQLDALTGLYNRRRFTELAAHDVLQARRYGHPLSVIMFDMDSFKQVNDTYGHAVGDEVLRGVAEVCRRDLRDVDVAARWGGEEFVVLLPHTGIVGAQETAERLRVSMESLRADLVGELGATASFGVATLHQEDLEDLLLRADACLYEAKNGGRNRVRVAEPLKG